MKHKSPLNNTPDALDLAPSVASPVGKASTRSSRHLHARTQRKAAPLPTYERRAWSAVHHGRTHHDDFHWLSDRRDPKVQRLLHGENDLVSRFFDATAPGLQRTLCKEMRARAKLDDASLPTVDRHFWYYTRQLKNEEYALHCRRPYAPEAGVNADFLDEVRDLWRREPGAPLPLYDDEETILDPNLLQRQLGLDFIEIGDMDISPDETRLAVTLDCSGGREIFTLFVLDIRDVNYGRWIEQDAGDVYRAWARDMTRKETSIYGSPTSSVGSHSRNSTPAALTTASATLGARGHRSGLLSPTALSRSPGPEAVVESPEGAHTSRAGLRFPSKPVTPVPSGGGGGGPRLPPPTHRIQHRIDMFDLSSEVLWLSDTCVLYVAVDDKMRPFQLVHHDLRFADDAPAASLICYEEADEEFWVGAVGFSADERYVTFSTASTEISEWHVCAHPGLPDRRLAERYRALVGAPVVQSPSEDGEDPVWLEAQDSGRTLTPTHCFTRRRLPEETPLEYELDHHATLLRDGPAFELGAWVIVSNASGFKDFALFVLPDAEGQSDEPFSSESPKGTTLGDPTRWQQLVEVGPDTKLEGVEVCLDYLLLTVRSTGTLTVLLLPVSTVRAWWATTGSASLPGSAVAPPLPLTQLVDLSQMLYTHQSTLLAWQDASLMDAGPRQTEVCPSLTCTLEDLLHHPADHGDDSAGQRLPFTVEAYGATTSFATDRFRVHVGHLVHPTVVYEVTYAPHGAASGAATLTLRQLRVELVNGGYEASAYTGTVVWVPSSFGFARTTTPPVVRVPTEQPSAEAMVPVYLCWKQKPIASPAGTAEALPLTQRPMLLNVYGSYGDCAELDFSSERLSLLDRGFVWAYAGVRGGGECGIAWRDAGRKKQRATSVNDLISVADFLQDRGYCAPGRLSLSGGSAGGLVAMRAVLQVPRLFHAVVAAVPFVDCLTTLLDDTLPLTVTEWSECGNPVQDVVAYDLLELLTPVEVLAQWTRPRPLEEAGVPSSAFPALCASLPHLLVETALDDSRVGYWEPLKLMAYLRELFPLHPTLRPASTGEARDVCDKGEDAVVNKSTTPSPSFQLHYCDFLNGHGGANGRFQQWEETAREYAFVIACQAQAGGEM